MFQAVPQLFEALWQTIYMVFVSSFFSIVLGLALGVVLFVSRQGQAWQHPLLYRSLSFIVNVTRSVPFVILMIFIIPFTRLLVGSSIGTNAAIVPLTLSAIPFYARITESALLEVPYGLIEASHSMGATTWQMIVKALLPEALVPLINGGTLLVINLIGYSAMAGAVGGGGLGELAIQYGYQRFDLTIMLETVVILVLLVQWIQWCGDWLAKKRSLKPLFILTVVLWVASLCVQFWPTGQAMDTIKVGIVSGPQSQVMEVAQAVAKKDYHLNIQIVTFDDYVLPNTALNNGEIDANIFQHIPYLDAQIQARGYKITAIGKTFVYPMAIYSRHITALSQLPYGAKVGIPNDPSNEGRALLLLQKAGLIQLKPKVGLLATPEDIVSNPQNLDIITLDAAALARVVPDVSMVVLNNDYVANAGFKPQDAIYREGPGSPYANIIVVRDSDVNRGDLETLVKVMHSDAVVQETYKLFPGGSAIPAWPGAPQPQ